MEKIRHETVESLQNHISLYVDSMLETDEEGGLPHFCFLNWCIEELVELDEVEGLLEATHDEKGSAVHGYNYSEYDGKLDLYITSYKRANEEYTIYKNDAEATLKRLYNFAERYTKEKVNNIKIDIDNDGAWNLVELMRLEKINIIRFFLFTDGKSTIERSEDIEINGIPSQTFIWDIQRFLRMQAVGTIKDDTDVIISDFGYDHLSCSATLQDDDDIETYLCIVPGNFLADIYMNFTTRLIERNVRSFLSFKSKINQGMLKTIQNEPNKFIAYNNGLTATATDIELNEEKNKITKIYGLQIVNGGQTTNTIFRAKHANKESVDEVSVSLKLCVLSEDKIDEIGPNISRFANTQNAIRRTDFSSNNAVYRQIEQTSRKMLAPPKKGYHTSSQWFFERTRGQYTDMLSMNKTAAQKKKFQNQYPQKQKFDKAQLCKCWGVWYQDIERVSHGAETYHPIFLEDIETNKTKFDMKDPDISFRKLVAMKIIFDNTRSIILKEKYGTIGMGHVTDYTIALISNLSAMRLNLIDVWNNQEISEEFVENVHFVAPIVGQTLASLCIDKGFQARSVARGNNKVNGNSFWDILKEKKLELPKQFKSAKGIDPVKPSGPTPTTTSEQQDALDRAGKLTGDVFKVISSWAKETGNLQPFQRSICYSVGKTKSYDKQISGKQALHAMKAYDEAISLGFKSDD